MGKIARGCLYHSDLQFLRDDPDLFVTDVTLFEVISITKDGDDLTVEVVTLDGKAVSTPLDYLERLFEKGKIRPATEDEYALLLLNGGGWWVR
jgi:hypothetical protein